MSEKPTAKEFVRMFLLSDKCPIDTWPQLCWKYKECKRVGEKNHLIESWCIPSLRGCHLEHNYTVLITLKEALSHLHCALSSVSMIAPTRFFIYILKFLLELKHLWSLLVINKECKINVKTKK